jgi:transposase-like protein
VTDSYLSKSCSKVVTSTEIVVLCVRWYLSFKLSYRDLVALMGERGIHLAHTTILRWVQHYALEFEKR